MLSSFRITIPATHDNKHTASEHDLQLPSFITHSHASLAVIRICEIKEESEGGGGGGLGVASVRLLQPSRIMSHHDHS